MDKGKDFIIGTCRFCGQTAQISGAISQSDADDEATMTCRCYQGANWRGAQEREKRLQKSITSAEQVAYEMVGNDDKKQNVLSAIIEGVARNYIDAAAVSTSATVKIQIKRVKRAGVDGISITKTTTIKDSEEI